MNDKNTLDHLQSFLTPRRKALFEKVLAQRTDHLTVVAQDVYQLHNTSAVVRSCDVFGIQNIHVIEEKIPRRIDKEIAMGAQKWVDINRYTSTTTCLKNLKKKGYRIVATSPHDDSQLLEDFDISTPAALFFGTEKDGLSEEVMREADATVKIPMVGFTESLNISVSAAIILQSLTTKLRKSGVEWQFSEEEKNLIRMNWTKKTVKNSEEIIEHFLNQ
ncbi:TrmH family RNA methyltransferase [Christiangramia forsetii]|uniref:tRNA (guanosine(18)-2'-O)-methyltransferase n=2 Tax=Christiangramia forsetii TaxID=411153 RepID=A0M0C5_CHRFK|nr:RNA methyltransferase [Christiangramia forsetii]GGG41252.1 tRNA (guanosine(18)-2'-O)-methyltransferase [Christiangramia forsetii]CAL66070.1 TrmH family tRNA/rRNA methyltransferase [Christiangramia forsetii KT0803]